MRGVNLFIAAGKVGQVTPGETRQGQKVCSFMFYLEKEEGYTTRVRVNAYGVHVDFCLQRLQKDDWIYMQGELMNRAKVRDFDSLILTEVRLLDIRLISKGDFNGKEKEG